MMNPALANDAPPEDDLTHLSFKDPMWLQAFPLNVHSVLDYFALSQFYDKKCNNEIIKMQRLEMSLMRNLRGIEYELIHVREPVLFVIRKQFRESPDITIPRATYYILNGSIYQAPTLFSVMNSRLSSSIHYARESLKELSSMIKFHPGDGHSWTNKPDGTSALPPPQAPLQKRQVQQYDPLIASLFHKFPPPAPPTLPTNLPGPSPNVNSPIPSQPGAMPPPPPVSLQGLNPPPTTATPSIPPPTLIISPLPAANGIVHSQAAPPTQPLQSIVSSASDLKRKHPAMTNPTPPPVATKRR